MSSPPPQTHRHTQGAGRTFRWLAMSIALFIVDVLASMAFSRLTAPVAATGGQRSSSATARQTPVLHVAEESLDLGMLWAESGIEHTFVMTNRTETPVEVDRISTSCDCTAVSPAQFRLAPGEQQSVQLSLDLTKASGTGTEPTVDSFSTHLLLFFSDGREQTVTLRGTSAAVCTISALPVVFDGPLRYGEDTQTARFKVTRNPRIGQITATADAAEADVFRIDRLSSGQTDVFEVRPHLRRSLGEFTFDVTVYAQTPEGQQFGPYLVPVVGRLEADVNWTPSSLLLLVTEEDTAPSETITLWSESGRSIDVLEEIQAPSFLKATIHRGPDAAPGDPDGRTVVRIEPSEADMQPRRSQGTVIMRVRSPAEDAVLPIEIPVTLQRVQLEKRLAEAVPTAAVQD